MFQQLIDQKNFGRSRIQVDAECGVKNLEFIFGMNDKRQGIVHIIGPEQGFTQPGTIIVCGDSHTATHGAFGALAFGIGTSEVEHVLATQTLVKKSKNFRINVNGSLPIGVIQRCNFTNYWKNRYCRRNRLCYRIRWKSHFFLM